MIHFASESVLRIDSSHRPSGISGRTATGKVGSGVAFVPAGEVGPSRVASSVPTVAMAGFDAILALQTVGDYTESRRKSVKRGKAMLDLLEDMKADLLVGQVSSERLGAMVEQLSSMRERVDAGLDALIDDIELRVRVELAKQGVFPAL